jgi:hypothetical protein
MKAHGNTTHGHAGRSKRSPEWLAWCSMIRRCTMPSQDSYPLYGGRGIKVCDRWRHFEAFLADMGPKPAGLTLERKDSNKDYEPGNCRWATTKEQARNTSRSRRLTHDGVTLTVVEWEERTGIPSSVIRGRIDKLGWPVCRALTELTLSQAECIVRAKAVQVRAPIAEYVAALERGESCEQIGSRYGVTSSGVRKALLRAGIKAGDYTQTTEKRRARAHLNDASTRAAIGKIGRRA